MKFLRPAEVMLDRAPTDDDRITRVARGVAEWVLTSIRRDVDRICYLRHARCDESTRGSADCAGSGVTTSKGIADGEAQMHTAPEGSWPALRRR